LCSAGYTGFEGQNPHERTNKTVRSTGDVDEEGARQFNAGYGKASDRNATED